MTGSGSGARAIVGVVLLTLATGQFLMTLDTSVMNVAIATAAEDVGTDVTGIQTAITLYTLMMATLMITGGMIGALIGRKRAFAIGCVIYGAGSFTTAILPVVAGPADRMVAAGGRWRGIDPAGDHRARGRQLRSGGPVACVRPGDGGRSRRRRSRAADRGAVHHLSQLAVGVRRRGVDRGGDPRLDAPDRGRAAREASPHRPRRCRPLRGVPGPRGLWGPALERLGLGRTEARRSGAPRSPRPCG
jgi:hypothetical protein